MRITQPPGAVREKMRQGVVGALVYSGDVVTRTGLNSDPQAQQVTTITVDTANNNQTYEVTFTNDAGESVTAEYTSDGSATKTEIRDGLEAALLAEDLVYGSVTLADNSTDKLDLTARYPGVGFTLSALDSDLSQSTSTSNDAADPIGFGLAVVRKGQSALGDVLVGLPKKSGFTAQASTITVTFAASAKYTITVRDAAGGWERTIVVDADTNDNTTASQIESRLDQALAGLQVTASVATNVVTLTASLAGFEFEVSTSVDTASAAATVALGTVDRTTSFLRSFYGVTERSLAESAASIGATSTSYAANAGVRAVQRGCLWVESSQSPSHGADLYVSLANDSTAGRFYTDSGSDRILVPRSMLEWEADGLVANDNLAQLRVHRAA